MFEMGCYKVAPPYYNLFLIDYTPCVPFFRKPSLWTDVSAADARLVFFLVPGPLCLPCGGRASTGALMGLVLRAF